MRCLIIALACLCYGALHAEQGRWPLPLLKNEAERFQRKGIQIPITQIYDSAAPSLNKALVILGNACNGVFISETGLILATSIGIRDHLIALERKNSAINSDGYWAENRSQEIPLEDLYAYVLLYHRSQGPTLNDSLFWIDGQEPEAYFDDDSTLLSDGHHGLRTVNVFRQSKTEAHEYVAQTLHEVRLVGIAPSNHCYFQSDKGSWPNLEAPLVILRAYGSDGRPYRPQAHVKISMDGWRSQDVVFSLKTQHDRDYRWAASPLIESFIYLMEKQIQLFQAMADLNRDLRTINHYNFFNDRARGMDHNIKKLSIALKNIHASKIVDHKKHEEDSLRAWMLEQESYAHLWESYEQLYTQWTSALILKEYFQARFLGPEIFDVISAYIPVVQACVSNQAGPEFFDQVQNQLLQATVDFYEDYNANRDFLLHLGLERLDSVDPSIMKMFTSSSKQLFLNAKQLRKAYANSFFTSKTKCVKALTERDTEAFKALEKDPLYQYTQTAFLILEQIEEMLEMIHTDLRLLLAQYTMADISYRQASQKKARPFPEMGFHEPAVSIGHIQAMAAPNGMVYRGYTTLDDLLRAWKEDSSQTLSPRFIDLCESRNFGPYIRPDEQSPIISFLVSSDEDYSGSGSPLFNAKGELIGIRNEFYDVAGDLTLNNMYYDAAQHRVIYSDIRYFLFFMDSVVGAKNLLREMGLR